MRQIALLLFALTLLASEPAAQATPLRAERVYKGFARPVQFLNAPGDSGRAFVVEQDQADIQVIDNGVKIATPFLDLTGFVSTGGEQGLLGMAFHPDYQSNRFFYVNYTSGGGTKLVRFERDPLDANRALPGSAQTVIEYSQPQQNHNGGGLVFGPDGYLWIATGDGGNANDTGPGHVSGGNAQSGATLLGKMLRIDVDADDFPTDPDTHYAIPPDNPYVDDPTVLNEIIHFGLRNPWRYSFDRQTGDLWIGDVGQGQREEVDYLARPGVLGAAPVNWGWRCLEATKCTGLTGCSCMDASLRAPLVSYKHAVGRSVTGGFVYRGNAIPDLAGTYFYADFSFSKIFSLRYDGVTLSEQQDRSAELDPPGNLAVDNVASFGEDAFGELYLCDWQQGEIFKIVPDGPFRGIGGAFPGPAGLPLLFGTGGIASGQAGALHVRNAAPGSLAVGFVSLGQDSQRFFGGTLVPGLPATLALNVFTDTNGDIDLAWNDLGNQPPGLEIFIQFGFVDPGALFGVSLSNALVATVP